MEFVVGAIGLASLALNLLIYQRLRATDAVRIVVELPAQEPVDQVPEPPVAEPAVPVVPEADGEKYQAWRNRKGIPSREFNVPPPPTVKRPVPGPLERPGGFV